jgi:sec-independent protein translocase protein TatB
MFDVGFSELVLIGVVALVVLGPERLPGAARTAGTLLRRARASWASVKAEVEREVAAEELKRSLREGAAAMDVRADLQATANEMRSEVQAAVDDAAKVDDEHRSA